MYHLYKASTFAQIVILFQILFHWHTFVPRDAAELARFWKL